MASACVGAIKARQRSEIEHGLPPDSRRYTARIDCKSEQRCGIRLDDVRGPADKVDEEMREVRALLDKERGAESEELEAELGDLLFAVVNLCRKAGVHHRSRSTSERQVRATFRSDGTVGRRSGIAVRQCRSGGVGWVVDEVKAPSLMHVRILAPKTAAARTYAEKQRRQNTDEQTGTPPPLQD